MVDIVLPGPQVGIIHFFKYTDQCVALLFEGPFGVILPLTYKADGFLNQRHVLEHEQVSIDERCNVYGSAGGDLLLDCA